MKNRGKRYPKAFKRECVDYVRKNKDIPVSEAADNLGVPNSTLQRWVKQADIDDGISKSGALTSVEKLEFQRLKREVRKRKIEAENLKNVVPVL
jgi:transposase